MIDSAVINSLGFIFEGTDLYTALLHRLLEEWKLSQLDIDFACRFEITHRPLLPFGKRSLTVHEAHRRCRFCKFAPFRLVPLLSFTLEIVIIRIASSTFKSSAPNKGSTRQEQ